MQGGLSQSLSECHTNRSLSVSVVVGILVEIGESFARMEDELFLVALGAEYLQKCGAEILKHRW